MLRDLRHIARILMATGLSVLVASFVASSLSGSREHFDRMVGWANILAFALSAAGVVIQLVAWSRPTSEITPAVLDERARQLAEDVLHTETLNLRRLVGGDEMARVTFVVRGIRTVVQESNLIRRVMMRFRDSSGRELGDLAAVATYFRALPLPRMVVLGPPGAGKTIMLIAFVVQAVHDRGDRTSVPVRIDLAGYDPFVRDLTSWLTSRIAVQYRIAGPIARKLLETGRVLPVLDGLDEMDGDQDAPDRGVAALGRIESYVAGQELGVVLACRDLAWDRISSDCGGLMGASVIRIQRLEHEQIRQYIAARLSEGPPSGTSWTMVMTRLSADPYGPLAEALSRPLWLYLAVLVFRTDPTSLVAASDTGDLRRLLIAGFVPAATRLLPRPGASGGQYFGEEEVQRWLCELARFLTRPDPERRDSADILPDQLWPIAGTWRVRLSHASFTILMILLAAYTTRLSFAVFFRAFLKDAPIGNVILLVSFLIFLGYNLFKAIRFSAGPSFTPTLIGRPQFRRVRLGRSRGRTSMEWSRKLFKNSFTQGYAGKLTIGALLAIATAVNYVQLYKIFDALLFLDILVVIAACYIFLSLASLMLDILFTPISAFLDFSPQKMTCIGPPGSLAAEPGAVLPLRGETSSDSDASRLTA